MGSLVLWLAVIAVLTFHEIRIRQLTKETRTAMSDIDDKIAAINAFTDQLAADADTMQTEVSTAAADLAALRTQLANAPTVTPAVLASMDAVTAKLSATHDKLGAAALALRNTAADPANPVPAAPVAPTPQAATPPATGATPTTNG